MRTKLLATLCCLGLVGCGESTVEPVIEGYDLAVRVSPAIPTEGIDPVTGMGIVAPADMQVPYVVRNRGTEASPAGKLKVWVGSEMQSASMYVMSFLPGFDSPADSISLPAIQPGDSITGIATVRNESPYMRGDASADSVIAHAETLLPDSLDANPLSNSAASSAFHVAMPILDVKVAPLPVKLRTDEPFPVTVTVENRSRHASASGLELRLCPWDFDQWCEPAWYASFGYLELPDIPPASAFTTTYSTVIPPSAVEQSLPTIITVGACLVEQAWTDPYLGARNARGWPSQVCPSGSDVHVIPDLVSACSPPVLTPGQTVTLPDFNCGIRPLTTQSTRFYTAERSNEDILRERFNVFSFMAVPGRVYRFAEDYHPSTVIEPDFSRTAIESLPQNAFRVTRQGLYLVKTGRNASATLLDITP